LLLVVALTILPLQAEAQTPLPPEVYTEVDTTSTTVFINIPTKPAGEPAPSGISVGLLYGSDVGMPGYWGAEERRFYPWTPCLKDVSYINNRTYIDEAGGLAFPGTSVGAVMQNPLMGRCILDGETGQYEIIHDDTPLPDVRIPVASVTGNFPVPGAHLTEEYGRHMAYFSGNPYHMGVDFVGTASVSAGDITLPKQTIFAPFPCEPVWVRAGVITCATPMPLSGSSHYDTSGWADYWANEPSGLTLLLTYLHVNTCNTSDVGQIGRWNQYKGLLDSTSAGELPDVFAGTLDEVVPERGTALTTYCSAPTIAACGTTAAHLHLQVSVVQNSAILPTLRKSGSYRISPMSGCTGSTSRWSGGWWSRITAESVTPISMWKSPSEMTSVTSNPDEGDAATCFGSTTSSASLDQFKDRILSANGGSLPTPYEIYNDAAYSQVLKDWQAWTNSFAYDSPTFGLCSPVADLPCPAASGYSITARDQGYPGGYPSMPFRYSNQCAPTYPGYPSRSCSIFEYIPTPGGSQDAGSAADQYKSTSARSLFFNSWWLMFGDSD